MFHLVASSSSTASGCFFFRDPRHQTHASSSISISWVGNDSCQLTKIYVGIVSLLFLPRPTESIQGCNNLRWCLPCFREGKRGFNHNRLLLTMDSMEAAGELREPANDAASTAADTYCLTARDIRYVVMDIEGTTTPISFVANTLFPYARAHARAHLAGTYRTQQTMDDVALLRAQIDQDLADGVPGAVPVPEPEEADEEAVIDALVANVEAMIDADRKLPALKQLQGRIWRRGFDSGEIRGVVYDDVAQALAEWNGRGVRCCIYSSGSREAQRLIFGNTQDHGDLRQYLCGFFDTTVGPKRESRSYYEIWQTLGVDTPSQILFLTDVYQEATAARDAGLEVLISIRPGNVPLPEDHGFQTITSFAQISV